MKRKQRRLVLIGAAGTTLALAATLVLTAFQQTIVFFNTPSELVTQDLSPQQRIRLGGIVAEGSVIRGQGTEVSFAVTDQIATVDVVFEGILPDLFREGQGVVTEGILDTEGVFMADTVLAKHDENYMPKEVADALKEQGLWQHSDGESNQQ
ncbi:MAG: cytochrome c maturation protein CcmE [Pseudomonadota bacterium]